MEHRIRVLQKRVSHHPAWVTRPSHDVAPRRQVKDLPHSVRQPTGDRSEIHAIRVDRPGFASKRKRNQHVCRTSCKLQRHEHMLKFEQEGRTEGAEPACPLDALQAWDSSVDGCHVIRRSPSPPISVVPVSMGENADDPGAAVMFCPWTVTPFHPPPMT